MILFIYFLSTLKQFICQVFSLAYELLEFYVNNFRWIRGIYDDKV